MTTVCFFEEERPPLGEVRMGVEVFGVQVPEMVMLWVEMRRLWDIVERERSRETRARGVGMAVSSSEVSAEEQA
jgi:hypothetical protein